MSESHRATVGRSVHYQSFGTPGGEYASKPRAATVTEASETDPDTVSLCIMNPTGLFFTQGVKYADPPKPGCWNWPPRV